MSGRTRVTLPDGRRVIGFRKTLRRNPKKKGEIALWRLGFALPDVLAFALRDGAFPGVIGLRIEAPGYAVVTGRNKAWVLTQAGKFLKLAGKNRVLPQISAHLTRMSEAGPTLSGPLRPGTEETVTLTYDGRSAVVIEGTSMRTLVP